jgi:hypothetical protein
MIKYGPRLRNSVAKPVTEGPARRTQQHQQSSLSSSLQFIDRHQHQQQQLSAAVLPSGVQVSNRCDSEEGDCMELKPVPPQVSFSLFCLACGPYLYLDSGY